MRKDFNLNNYIVWKNKYERLKLYDYIRIRSKIKATTDLNEFLEETKDLWDQQFFKIIDNLIKNLFGITDIVEYFTDHKEEYLNSNKHSTALAFKSLNLMIALISIGGNFNIKSKNIF